MAKHNIHSPSNALAKILIRIDLLAPKCPLAFRQEDHNIYYLRSVVIGKPWAIETISKVDSDPLS